METGERPLAVVTGASTGIGFELARCCADHGYDVVVAADEPEIHEAARRVQTIGTRAVAVQADLSTPRGVETLYSVIASEPRPVAALLANAGRGLGRAFLDQDFSDIQRVIHTNITGTVDLIQRVGRGMRERRAGRILITGSIASFTPGTYQAVYNGTKAFLDSFSFALRAELKDTGVSVTCLMPGATETDFFERAGMMDTKLGTRIKMSAAEVASVGFEAMQRGDADVIAGWQNKLRAAIARLMPAEALAAQQEKLAGPGTSAR